VSLLNICTYIIK